MARARARQPKGKFISAQLRAGRRKVSAAPDDADSLEKRIVSFARSGKLKKAGSAAVQSQFDSGLSVVYQKGNLIVREQPDGTLETVRTLDSAFQAVPDRFRSFVVKKHHK